MIGSTDIDYVRPTSVSEVVELLRVSDPRARILAGGTDLLVDLRSVRCRPVPERLIDIKSVPELQEIEVDEKGAHLTIGAAVPLNRIVEHPWIRQHVSGLAAAAASIGTYQIRNRATLAGNLCNASPAADTAPVLLALGATLQIMDRDGARLTPLKDFLVGVKKTTLAEDAFVSAVKLPVPAGTRTAFAKQQRVRGHDLAVASTGGAYSPDAQTIVVAIGSCAPAPVLFDPVLVGDSGVGDLAERLGHSAEQILSPIDDVRASAAYRRGIVPVLIKQIILELLGDDKLDLDLNAGGGTCTQSR